MTQIFRNTVTLGFNFMDSYIQLKLDFFKKGNKIYNRNINLPFDCQDLCHTQLYYPTFRGGIVAQGKIG